MNTHENVFMEQVNQESLCSYVGERKLCELLQNATRWQTVNILVRCGRKLLHKSADNFGRAACAKRNMFLINGSPTIAFWDALLALISRCCSSPISPLRVAWVAFYTNGGCSLCLLSFIIIFISVEILDGWSALCSSHDLFSFIQCANSLVLCLLCQNFGTPKIWWSDKVYNFIQTLDKGFFSSFIPQNYL